MNADIPHILLLEPYYGGSHRAFLKGLRRYLDFRFTLIGLPARKWKMRMQLAAPWMADEIARRVDERFDAILCSTFIDAATLKALLAQREIHIPLALYFHENQFAYPNRIKDPAWHQFTALNFTSALAADTIAFNSRYNSDTFFAGVEAYLKKAVDMDVMYKVEELRQKSVVLHPGIDFSNCTSGRERSGEKAPVVVWNHRWEHDKDPETFFRTMLEFAGRGADFKLIVLGQHFERCPGIFARARKALGEHMQHYGYVADRAEYIRLLREGDLVASTALHEFFGMAVLEAVHCGCRPLVPDRLSYRELFPEAYRYREGGFSEALAGLLRKPARLTGEEALRLTDRFSWLNMAEKYEQWLSSVV